MHLQYLKCYQSFNWLFKKIKMFIPLFTDSIIIWKTYKWTQRVYYTVYLRPNFLSCEGFLGFGRLSIRK